MKFNIDIKNIKVTKVQQKLFAAAFIIIAAVIVFIVFIFIPQMNRFEAMKSELASTEKEIAEIKTTTGTTGDEPMAKALEALQNKFKLLNAKLPPKEELILRELPNFANRFGVEIKSMQPQKKRAITKIGDMDVTIKGHTVEEFQIAIVAAGRYKEIGEYLHALKNEFPAAIRIIGFNMTQTPGGGGRLAVNFSIMTFLVSETAPTSTGG